MRKVSFGIACLIALAVFAFLVPGAGAYSQYSVNRDATNCRACHGDFLSSPYTSLSDGQNWGDDLHDIHRNTMLGGDCDVCHGSGPRFPVLLNSSVGGNGLSAISCVGCHGRNEDVTPNDGAFGGPGPGRGDGLRAHHAAAGVGICAGCHTADAVQVGEDVLPPYYATPGTGHPNMPTDPCNLDGNEDFAGSAEGLDNDGDDIYDGADPDCQAAAPTISVAPTSKDYGNVQVGNSSSQVFNISNGGTADLVVSGMTLSDTSNFSLTTAGGSNTCGSATPTIAAGNNCTVSVAFNPTLVAAFSETFSIASNDAGTPTLNVSLGGNGVAVPTPTISVSPSSIDYGQVVVADSSSRVVTVSNTGSGDLVVSGMTLADTTNFSLDTSGGTNPCGSAVPTIAGLDNCTVSVTFSPLSLGSFTDNLSIASNDTANPTLDVSLTGNGVAAAPNIAVSPASIDYGNVNVGSTATREVTISNAGTADLNVSGIILSDNTVIHTLDLGGGANPCVTASTVTTPPLDGAQAGTTSTGTGTATITYDEATNLLSWDITYSGLSGPPTAAHFHGPAVPGDNAAVQVPITVTPSPLIGSATITDAQEADLLAGLYYVNIHTALSPLGEIRGQVTAPVTIAANDNCTVAVTFIPPAAGTFPATLTVNSDDSDSPSTVVSITGMGSTPPTGGGGGGCSVIGSGSYGGGGAVLFLTLLAILVTLRRQRAMARR